MFLKPHVRFWPTGCHEEWYTAPESKAIFLHLSCQSEANLLSPFHPPQFAEAGGTTLVWVKSEPSAQATNPGVLPEDFSYFSLDGHTQVYTSKTKMKESVLWFLMWAGVMFSCLSVPSTAFWTICISFSVGHSASVHVPRDFHVRTTEQSKYVLAKGL